MNAFAARMERVAQTPRTVGWLGIALGTLAFWLSLPPVEARAPWVPLIVGLLAASCGVWAVSRGVGRLGWGAVAVGAIGIVLGVLATRSSSGNLHSVVTWGSLIGSTLVWATPLAYAAVGGMINERSGVVNIGLEGMMLAGAFFGCLGADKFGSWEMGVLTAAVAGGGFALLHAFFAIHLRADQIVGGTAINFLALGVTGYFFIQVYGANGTPGDLPRVPDANIPGLKQHTFFGDAIGHLNYMIWPRSRC
jgi:general nucleoside transport system permease protein